MAPSNQRVFKADATCTRHELREEIDSEKLLTRVGVRFVHKVQFLQILTQAFQIEDT